VIHVEVKDLSTGAMFSFNYCKTAINLDISKGYAVFPISEEF
jgi:hypothetical protein